MVKHIFLLLISTFIFGIAVGYFFGYDHGFEQGGLMEEIPILSFEDCVIAGYPVMESYPEQCATPDGKHFVRDISANDSAAEEGNTGALPEKSNERPTACTMDAKICPDGSGVGRVGPDCAFAPCPGE